MSQLQIPSGTILAGRYRIIEERGRGGMGVVLLAEDLGSKQLVALKLLLGSDGEAEQLSLRFRREFRAIQRILHPHVVRVHDYGVSEYGAFFTMDFVQGQDLAKHVGIGSTSGRRAPVTPRALNDPDRLDRLQIAVRQAFEALAALHASQMIHRDLKPGNILVDDSGQVKLIDFGLARDIDEDEDMLASQGLVAGTVEYMAPEQLLGSRLDSRCDLYSMGVILFECLAGRKPYEGMMTRQQLLERPPAVRLYNPEVPRALESITLKLLQKDPFERFQSAVEFLDALELASKNRNAELDAGAPIGRGLRPGVASLLPQRFVGRNREMAVLQLELQALSGGAGGLVLIGGEAGIGKSRMIEELRVASHLLGMRTARGACFAEGDSTWGAVGQAIEKLTERLGSLSEEEAVRELGADGRALAQIVPRFAESAIYRALPPLPPAEGQQARYSILAATASLVRALARKTPLVLMLDDLQWSSAPALELLTHLVRKVAVTSGRAGDAAGAAPLLILGTYRTNEVEGHPVEAFLSQTRVRGLGKILKLERLTPAEVAELVSATLGDSRPAEALCTRLVHESGGNPFFLEEILKGRLEDGSLAFHHGTWQLDLPEDAELEPHPAQTRLPASVQVAVHRRLERLGPADLELLACAALLGRQFSFQLLQAATERPEEELLDWVDRMLKVEILVEDRQDGNLLEFDQDTIREVVAAEIPEPRRLSWHRTIAGAAERLYSADLEPHVELLAHHFFLAGLRDESLEYSWRASKRLRSSFRNDEAIAMLRRVLSLIGEKGDRLDHTEAGIRLESYQALGEILLHLSENREALECFQYLAELAPPGSTAFARARFSRGIARSRLGDPTAALEDFSAAIQIFERQGDAHAVAECHRESGRVMLYQDRFDEAHAQLKQALEKFQRCGDRLQVADVLSQLGVGFYLQNKDALALEYFEKALPVFEKLGDVKGIAQSNNRIGTCRIALGAFESAEKHLATAVRQLEAIEAMRDVLIGRINQGRAHAYLGHLGNALETQLRAVALGRELEDRYLLAAALRELALVLLHIGVPEQALLPIEEALSISRETKAPSREAMQLYDLGCIREELGDRLEARRLYLQAVRLAKQSENHDILISAQIRLLRLGRLPADSRKLLWNLLQRMKRAISPIQSSELVLVAADALLVADRPEQASMLASEVKGHTEQTGQRGERLRAVYLLARHALGAGKSDEAWELYDEALGLLHDLAETVPAELRGRFLQTSLASSLLSDAEQFVSAEELHEAFEDLGVDLFTQTGGVGATQDRLPAMGGTTSATEAVGAEFIVRSEAMARLHERLRRLATGEAPIFVHGEDGVGKSAAASVLHALSGGTGSFVSLSCEGLEPQVLQAQAEAARGGTLYLAEIGQLPPAVQAALVGRVRAASTLVVMGSSTGLPALARAGRLDLSVQRALDGRLVEIPPLRERREDIVPLAHVFLRRQRQHEGLDVRGISKAAEESLLRHDWPGNVAELEMQVSRAALICEGTSLEPEHFDLATR